MKLYIPFKGKYWITQKYAENATAVYNQNGRSGHGAFDIVGLDNKIILATCDAYVYSLRNVEPDGDLMQYSAIYTIVEDSGVFYEIVYGHVNQSFVKPGDTIKRGQEIGIEGNRGYVATGGKEVTRKEKENGSMKGSHLHFQLRIVKPVEKRKSGNTYLKDSKGYVRKDGMYFEVLNYDNGYVGCVDPEPFMVYQNANISILEKIIDPFIEKPIKRNLRYGSRGEDVKIIQKKLGGLIVDGIFGKLTDASVRAFQKKNRLVVDGIVGPKTTTALLGRKQGSDVTNIGMASEKYKLNSVDFKKIGTGALLAVGGALITYLAETLPSIDFGVWTPVATAFSAILLNALRKWIASQA